MEKFNLVNISDPLAPLLKVRKVEKIYIEMLIEFTLIDSYIV